jgi:prepilin-type processing-associated H-X9-DG protein
VKILLIEEDITAISDGEWWSGELEHDTLRKTSLSVIHDRGREYGSTSLADGQYWFQGRGNVVFADGHCDFIDRTKLLFKGWIDPHHQGGPY